MFENCEALPEDEFILPYLNPNSELINSSLLDFLCCGAGLYIRNKPVPP